MSALAPCNWPLAIPDEDEGVLPCQALYRLSDARREMVTDMAVELLWNWTNRKFGTCETEVRPCRVDCTPHGSTFWGTRLGLPTIPQTGGWAPALIGGEWFNIQCGACPSNVCRCSDDEAKALVLPGPVAQVLEVIVDGEILPPTSWTLRSGVLWRTDGGTWPACNNQSGDPLDPETGAWTITYSQGYPVPSGGKLAAYRLTCELAMALLGDDDCALPQRVSSVTREGVSMAILDGFENLESGMTGIWEIDSWIRSVTVDRKTMPKVYSPDVMPDRDTSRALGQGRWTR